jgi:hypothetical protein
MTIKVHVYVSLGWANADRSAILEFDDGTPDSEIEEACKEWKDEKVEWSWSCVTDDEIERIKSRTHSLELPDE